MTSSLAEAARAGRAAPASRQPASTSADARRTIFCFISSSLLRLFFRFDDERVGQIQIARQSQQHDGQRHQTAHTQEVAQLAQQLVGGDGRKPTTASALPGVITEVVTVDTVAAMACFLSSVSRNS